MVKSVFSSVRLHKALHGFRKCAARNYMLTASGPMSPVNLGVWAFKPDLALLDTTLDFLRSVDYYDVKAQIGGWDWIGFRPSGGGFVGDDCGQGLLWYDRARVAMALLNNTSTSTRTHSHPLSVNHTHY
eukprot:m.1011783 g.1011783  ORF g.1011783 m.1011783 type:complete len:129 (-) comp24062_c0_seq34:4200-4586(-)